MTDFTYPKFEQDSNGIFKLVFKTSLLSFITLGIYRFWATTRVRQYLWGSLTIDDDPLEYTGTGMEKLLGFLMAIVILAIYLGLVQFALTFVGLNLTMSDDPEAAFTQFISAFISLGAILPLIAFATYRARRYKMSRTLWRGIRFGMESAAWGFVGWWLFYTLIQVVTLGILTPLKTFRLEKNMADRSYFGSAKMEQGGKWTELFSAMKHIFIGGGILILAAGLAYADSIGFAIFVGVIGYIWLFVGMIDYGVKSFAYLTSHKTIEGGLALSSEPSTGFVIKTTILMGLALSIIISIVFGIVGAIALGLAALGPILSVIVIALAYIGAIAMTEALSMAWITMPILAHYIEASKIAGFEHIAEIRQREADSGADAEGFADALDIGGAF